MRRFNLVREFDETGVSGTGTITEGVQFTNGTVVMRWLTTTTSVAYYSSIEDVVIIHGHNGATKVVWVDDI